MEDGFGDLSGDLSAFDDLLFDFPGSFQDNERPPLGHVGPSGGCPPLAESSSAVEDLRLAAPTPNDVPSPSSSSAAAAAEAADNGRAKRKAEQNRRDLWRCGAALRGSRFRCQAEHTAEHTTRALGSTCLGARDSAE